MDASGDGIGDLNGIHQRLDYLSSTLGVDALWLSPFFPSPMKDFGYDVADYCDVDPRFGSLKDLTTLIDAIHAHGMKVIVDYVANHCSDQHPWFQASRQSATNPKADWFVWKDPAPDGGPPNNWLSVFGGPAWTFDPSREQYYLHKFLRSQPDLNWRNPEVKDAMFDVLRFWLDRGVDGFRIDAAHFVMKDPDLRDNPPNPSPDDALLHRPMGDYDTQLHVHDKGHADVHGLFREMRTLLDDYEAETGRPVVSIGEIHLFDKREWASYYGQDLDELHMPFNFGLLKQPWTAEDIRASVDSLEAALPTGAWPNYVLANHDDPRLATRVGPKQARVGAMLLLTLRGTPTLYYGEELGLPNADIPDEDQQDPWGQQVPGLGRDGCRTPMPWTSAPDGGFSNAAPSDFWLPMHHGNGSTDAPISVADQLDDDRSMLTLYRRLLDLRRTSKALHAGRYAPIDDVPDGVFAYRRTFESDTGESNTGDDVKIIALNFRSTPAEMPLPADAEVLLSTTGTRHAESLDDRTLRLHADEGVVLHVL